MIRKGRPLAPITSTDRITAKVTLIGGGIASIAGAFTIFDDDICPMTCFLRRNIKVRNRSPEEFAMMPQHPK
jgi:hypothetical protein